MWGVVGGCGASTGLRAGGSRRCGVGSGNAPAPDWRPAIEAFRRAVEIDRADPGAGWARGLHTRMLANVLVKAGFAREAVALSAEALACTRTGDDRNASRVCPVLAKCHVALGDQGSAWLNLGEACKRAATAGATQYGVELEDLNAEIDYLAGAFGAARSR